MESATPYKDHHRSLRRRRRRRLCLICCCTTVLLLILGLTVFRVHHATTTVNSLRLLNLRTGLDIPNLSVDINVTLSISITATNPNHVSFRFGAGTAQLSYRGAVVGVADIPPGEVRAEGSVTMDVILTVFAGKLVADAQVYRDVIAGEIVVTTETRIPGRVTVLGVIKRHMVTYSTCDVTVDVGNQSVRSSDCRYKTKL